LTRRKAPKSVFGNPGERVEPHNAADQIRGLRGGDRGRPARQGLSDDDGRPAQVANQGEQVSAAIGAGN
jgi:hypothetical protein